MPKYSRIYLEISNICNKNCSFCHGTKREKRSMTFEEFKIAVNKIRHLTNYLYFHLMGEPLCHPQLPDFINYASSLGFKCAVTTNGTLLSKREDELLNSALYKINISLHSFEGDDVEKKKLYLDECLAFADKSSSKGILTILRLWNSENDSGSNAYSVEAIRERFHDGEWMFGNRGARIRDKLHLEYGERFQWPDIELDNMGDSVFCYGLSDHIGILSGGEVVPCCLDSDGVMTLGNIFHDDIDNIISSPRACSIKEGFALKKAREELCKRCGYARRFKL